MICLLIFYTNTYNLFMITNINSNNLRVMQIDDLKANLLYNFNK